MNSSIRVFGLNELDHFNKTVDLDDIVVYIDPLDGTKAFTEGKLFEVTSLIGVSYKNAPYIGLINQIWKHNEATQAHDFEPSVFLGMIEHDHVYQVSNPPTGTPSVLRSYSRFQKHDQTKPWRLNVSVNHYYKSVEDLIAFFQPSVEKSGVSGMGARFIKIVQGETDGFISNTSGAGRWDSLAGSALVQALGGKVTGVRGQLYSYNGDTKNTINTDGLFPLNDAEYHDQILPKFIEYYRSIGEGEGPLVGKKQ